MRGAALLEVYGPLLFVIAKQILPKLSTVLGDLFCNAQTDKNVHEAKTSTFTR
jgi:hypothetical protein